jgi:hypothetical protein
VLLAFIALATILSMALGTAPASQAAPNDEQPVKAAAAKAKKPTALSAPITGKLQDGTGKVDGLFSITKFAQRNGKLVAVGNFTGTITDAAGKVTAGSKKIAIPLDTAPAAGANKALAPKAAAAAAPLSCQVLDLVLGPLDLNLLGLKVHLDTVKLNITAQGGAGNLLGNLLCAVAGLLDGATGLNGILANLTKLLNQLLAVLG